MKDFPRYMVINGCGELIPVKQLCFSSNKIRTLSYPSDTIIHSDGSNLLEWTGLYDVNNQRIYEGHIVRCFNHGYEFYPYYMVGYIGRDYINFVFKYKTSGTLVKSMDITRKLRFEVIGNIYQHKHLLDGGNVVKLNK